MNTQAIERTGLGDKSYIKTAPDVSGISEKIFRYERIVQDSVMRVLHDGEFHPLLSEIKPSNWDEMSAGEKRAFYTRVREGVNSRRYQAQQQYLQNLFKV